MVRWGIAATGGIAATFVRALARVEDAEVLAVSSRTSSRAEEFAREHGIARPYAPLPSMLADPDVEIVYVASPHTAHCEQTVAALEAGKHVLCEKPFSMNEAETQRMLDAARASGTFLMEALWSRFLPAYLRLQEVVSEGVIGEVRSVTSSFGFDVSSVNVPDGHRILDLSQGGGSLLDMGIYPIQVAQYLLGSPSSVSGVAAFGPSGADTNTVVGMLFPNGAVAQAHSSLVAFLDAKTKVYGSGGVLELDAPVYAPEGFTVTRHVGEPVRYEAPHGGDGMRWEAMEVHRCLAAGLVESPLMPWSETLALTQVLDRARAAIGLRYPADT